MADECKITTAGKNGYVLGQSIGAQGYLQRGHVLRSAATGISQGFKLMFSLSPHVSDRDYSTFGSCASKGMNDMVKSRLGSFDLDYKNIPWWKQLF